MKSLILGLLLIASGSAFADGCYAPWGQYVPESASVQAYRESNPPRGNRCESEYRYCRNGYLSGFYSYNSCQEDYTCYDPDFGYLSNMMTVTAYLNPTESGGRHCQMEVRQCYYGRMTGSYRNRYCRETP